MDFELTEEQLITQNTVRKLVQKELEPVAAMNDREEIFPAEFFTKLAELGMMGMTIPSLYGGSDAGAVALSLVLQEIAYACPATALAVSVNHLVASVLLIYGTESQKKRFLFPVASGRCLAAIAFTEAIGGSNPKALISTSVKRNDGYLLKGVKQFITSGSRAGVILTFARFRSVNSSEDLGLNAFVLEKDTPGFRVGTLEEKMGIRAVDVAELIFEDCPLSAEHLLGKEREGEKVFDQALNSGRIGVASQAIGIGQACLDEAVAFAKKRVQNNRSILHYQNIRMMIAEMATELEAARYLTLVACQKMDDDRNFTKEASMAKYYASEMANRLAYKSLQIHGAHGYSKDFKIERLYRDSRATTIYEGTSEVQKLIIAREIIRSKS